MSFSTLVPLIQYTGNGSTTVFPFPHKYYNDEDIIVVLTDAADVDTVQTITTEYTLSGKAEDAHDQTTGSVTMLTAPAGGGTPEKLTIYRKPALTQITTLLNTGAWYALPLELRLDLIVMMIQEHELQLGRAAQYEVTNLDTPPPLESILLASGLGLVADLPGKGTVVDADTFMESDSADSDANKKVTASVIFAYVLTKFATVGLTLGGLLDMVDNHIDNVKTVTFNDEHDHGNSGATPTINWTEGQKQKITLTANATFAAFTPPAGPCNLLLKVVQDGTGSRTAAWHSSVKWPGGTAPVITTTLTTGTDIIAFYYDGTNYLGAFTQDFQ